MNDEFTVTCPVSVTPDKWHIRLNYEVFVVPSVEGSSSRDSLISSIGTHLNLVLEEVGIVAGGLGVAIGPQVVDKCDFILPTPNNHVCTSHTFTETNSEVRLVGNSGTHYYLLSVYIETG